MSIVVPARNEARVIERTVAAWLAQTYANIELIVVNDRSTDATGDILRNCSDPRLTIVDGEEPPAGWLGKPWALAQGSRRARGELLLFADADIIYAPESLAAIVARQERSGRDLTAILPNFEMHGLGEQAAMPMLAIVALTFLPTWLSNRTRSARLAVGGGSGNFVTRAAYDRAGGHTALANAVVDDIALARLIRVSGGTSEAVAAFDLVSVRMYHGLAEVVEGFTKNAFTTFGRSYVASVIVFLCTIVFHILPYGLAVAGNVKAIAIVALITAVRVVLFTWLRYPLWNALLLHPLMSAIWGWIYIRSMWVTGIRKQVVWRGRSYDAAETQFGAERGPGAGGRGPGI